MRRRPAIIVHGGAGRRAADLAAAVDAGCRAAVDAGWNILAGGGDALAAVVAAVTVMEDDPTFNAGVGSCLTADGTVEMDASVMDGASGRGAGVAVVQTIRNPVQLARAVLDDGRHVLLAGSGAEAFGRRCGLPTRAPEEFITARQRERWQQRVADRGGTVGAVAVDATGRVAAATSTGGLLGKLPGRIGDSAVIGAGTYADAAGAASATGDGEAIILAGLTRAAVDALRGGRAPGAVAAALVEAAVRRSAGAVIGLILVDRFGRLGVAQHAEHMPTAARTAGA